MEILSKRQVKVLDISTEIATSECNKIGFVSKSMVTASMPHARVKNNQYVRKNNNYTLTILGNADCGGLPYGTYPRLILMWIVTEVSQKKAREITLGKNLSDFMYKLGILVTGGKFGTINRFKDQMKKLFSSTISLLYEDKIQRKFVSVNMSIVDQAEIEMDDDLYGSKIIVSESFYKEILKSSIPIDLRAVSALKDSSLALDIYFWLTFRFSYLSETLILTFDNLFVQFGVGYRRTSHGKYEFKRKFTKQLKKVLAVYHYAKVKVNGNELILEPSFTHVNRRSIKNMLPGYKK